MMNHAFLTRSVLGVSKQSTTELLQSVHCMELFEGLWQYCELASPCANRSCAQDRLLLQLVIAEQASEDSVVLHVWDLGEASGWDSNLTAEETSCG